MTDRVLLIDDDRALLESMHRSLRKQFLFSVASSGYQGLDLMTHHGPFAVVISDMHMPGMSGITFLQEVKQRWPETQRIMLTGNADLQVAIEAVNRGEIFRFLQKPCPSEVLIKAINDARELVHLRQIEKELLEETLNASIRALAEVVAAINPRSHDLSRLTHSLAYEMAKRLDYPSPWQLEAAALLAPLGATCTHLRVSVDATVDPIHPYGQDQLEFSARLIEHIPRLEEVATIIRGMGKHFDGSGLPNHLEGGNSIHLGSRILFAVTAFTAVDHQRKHPVVAIEELRRRSHWFDPRIFEALESIITPRQEEADIEVLPIKQLKPGMQLQTDIRLRNGTLVFHKHTRLGRAHILMLEDLSQLIDLDNGISIRNSP